MTPIAAYYLFTALENQRAAAAAHGIDIRRRRPSLLDRVRALALALRGQPRFARSA
jgi:hypothetical protein